MLAKIASGYLAGIAIFRFHNYLKSKPEKVESNTESSFLEFLDTKLVDVENKESAENIINEFSQQKQLEGECSTKSF
jgi:hypothetical protein